ncbi:hypothetical protein GAMM_170102 [Gammaproteobacteria bacterium]
METNLVVLMAKSDNKKCLYPPHLASVRISNFLKDSLSVIGFNS